MSQQSEKDLDGFALRKILVAESSIASSEDRYAQLAAVSLALPVTPAVEELVRERCASAKAEVHRINLAITTKEKEEENTRRGGLMGEGGAAVSPGQRHLAGKEFDLETERVLLEKQFSETPVRDGLGELNRVQIMDWKEPLKLITASDVRTPDRDTRTRDQGLYRKLRDLGAYRQIAGHSELVQSIESLQKMRSTHPNFTPVIDFVEGQLRLAIDVGRPLIIPPILLGGPPGVGKTHFTLALAEALSRPMLRHSFDASPTASSLMGSARNWSNTTTGLVFDHVCLGARADPVILLDELDKAVNATKESKPLDPLHSLLEPVSACAVTDISAAITFNASYVTWIATANDLWHLPAPILSRFRVFHIQSPTAAQALEQARSVAESVHARFNTFEPPAKRITVLLAHLTPRQQIQVLEHAYANALVHGRRKILVPDLPVELRPEDELSGEQTDMLH